MNIQPNLKKPKSVIKYNKIKNSILSCTSIKQLQNFYERIVKPHTDKTPDDRGLLVECMHKQHELITA